MTYGGIEAGGTKWVCAVGRDGDDVTEVTTFPTRGPEETLARAIDFLRGHRLDAVGVGSFGPVDLRPGSPTWGRITTTPKPGWSDVDVAGAIAEALGVPVAFDTDVNAAALAEHVWGAAAGLDTFVYVTVGTGIGGGAIVGGRLLHGLVHPELGHIRVPHDRPRDPFDGVCPFHGDCLEGLASGEALRVRWGRPADELDDDAVWELEAEYLSAGLANVTFTLSPELIVLGGGVAKEPRLLPLVRRGVGRLLGDYLAAAPLRGNLDGYVVAPALGDLAGVRGALELARRHAPG